MKEPIKTRIEELENQLNNFRELIRNFNNEILFEGWKPDSYQQDIIDYTAKRGKETLAELEKLNKFLENLSEKN